MCGQIGGWGGPAVWDKCSCSTKDACADCYHWWDAISLESLATYGIYKNLKRKYWPFLKANEEEQNL